MEVLFSDPFILIVNKPSGLSTLPGGWENEPSLFKELEVNYGPLWIVHRLDKVTSGLVLFARTAEVHRNLSLQFERHQVLKRYHAIVNGVPNWKEYSTHLPLRIDTGHSHRTIVDAIAGKPSETNFLVLERYNGYTLLEAIPLTGRTHQIRAHAFAIGFPLLGDSLYHAPPTNIISRPALHAYSISFTHPQRGEPFALKAPYPKDFEESIQLFLQKR